MRPPGAVGMELRSTRTLRGHRFHDVAGAMPKAKTYGTGRICAMEGCGTRLSVYNPSGVCALHGGAWQEARSHVVRKTARREQLTRRCAFRRCDREFTTANPAKRYCCDACRMRAFQARLVEARRMEREAQPIPRAS